MPLRMGNDDETTPTRNARSQHVDLHNHELATILIMNVVVMTTCMQAKWCYIHDDVKYEARQDGG